MLCKTKCDLTFFLSQPVSVVRNPNHCRPRYRQPQVSTMKMSREIGAGKGGGIRVPLSNRMTNLRDSTSTGTEAKKSKP
jgi:hypothetical protein